jgi:uroporphyrinogen decarboxylase
MYRELIWPDHQRLADFAHAHGLKAIYHTDGDVNGVLDLYIGAGFDCLQPLEAKADMDVRTLGPRCGDRLALMGNIDARVLSTNDADRVEAEIATKLAAGMATRGYAYHSDHSVPPDVSWSTYRLVVDLLDRYGRYA